jgi:Patatin phospholipase
MHRPVTLTGDEQFVAAECHIHWLAADLDCRLLAKCRVDDTDRIAAEACDCDKAIVRAIASDLSALRNAFEAQGPGNDVARGVDQKQVGLLAVDSNHSAAVSRYRNAGKWPRGLHLVQKLTTAEINHRYGGVFFILCVQPPALRRNDQAVAISGFRLDGVHHLARGPDACGLPPEQNGRDGRSAFLEQEARVRIATLVQLKYQSSRYETATKNFEFSRAAMKERWQAGYNDAKIALGEPRVFELPHVTEAARIFDVHHGWVT